MKELVIDAAVENLGAVLDFIGAELEQNGCPVKLQTQIKIAAEEVFVNIAYYAYKPEPSASGSPPETGGVSVRLAVGEEVTIEFEDKGVPFNPLEKKDPDINVPASQREIGGLGIFMVKKIMDTVEYRHEDGKNILTIRKMVNSEE